MCTYKSIKYLLNSGSYYNHPIIVEFHFFYIVDSSSFARKLSLSQIYVTHGYSLHACSYIKFISTMKIFLNSIKKRFNMRARCHIFLYIKRNCMVEFMR